MAIITISRGSFSGGRYLAESLSRKLGYRCLDREVIVERAVDSGRGVTQEEIRQALEKPPGFLERFGHKRYVYLALVQAALAEEVRTGQVIYHGLAGHLLLRGGPHMFHTRIIAPLEYRIEMVRERLHYSRDQAIAHIRKMDGERSRWTRFLYGVNWEDASLYDVVINLKHLSIEKACSLICSLIRKRGFDFTPQCRQVACDFALASRVRAELALDPATCELEVETAARCGRVTVRGKLAEVEQLAAVKRIAVAVPGVKAIETHELVLPIPA